MNLNKLFEKQQELDARILLEKGLVGQDLLDKKILALQVELGELANEWRMFKFWKENPEPRTRMFRIKDNMGKEEILDFNPDEVQNGFFPEVKEFNPLLEEYVDCLHFILSIGLEMGCTPAAVDVISKEVNLNVTRQFAALFHLTASIRQESELYKKSKANKEGLYNTYHKAFSVFLGLGEMLGFTWEQTETAYMQKNEINHERQNNGY